MGQAVTANLDHTLPLEPLLFAARAENLSHLARMTGVTPRHVLRWKQRGLQWWTADEAAGAIGKHPAEVWGFAWYELPIDDYSVERAERKHRQQQRERAEQVVGYQRVENARSRRHLKVVA